MHGVQDDLLATTCMRPGGAVYAQVELQESASELQPAVVSTNASRSRLLAVSAVAWHETRRGKSGSLSRTLTALRHLHHGTWTEGESKKIHEPLRKGITLQLHASGVYCRSITSSSRFITHSNTACPTPHCGISICTFAHWPA